MSLPVAFMLTFAEKQVHVAVQVLNWNSFALPITAFHNPFRVVN